MNINFVQDRFDGALNKQKFLGNLFGNIAFPLKGQGSIIRTEHVWLTSLAPCHFHIAQFIKQSEVWWVSDLIFVGEHWVQALADFVHCFPMCLKLYSVNNSFRFGKSSAAKPIPLGLIVSYRVPLDSLACCASAWSCLRWHGSTPCRHACQKGRLPVLGLSESEYWGKKQRLGCP